LRSCAQFTEPLLAEVLPLLYFIESDAGEQQLQVLDAGGRCLSL
jgi:hypothetical protein